MATTGVTSGSIGATPSAVAAGVELPFPDLADAVCKVFADRVGAAERTPLFTTSFRRADKVYLDRLPEAARQRHNCRACLDFLSRFGSLVTIDDSGAAKSVMFDAASAPLGYQEVVRELQESIESSQVTGFFVPDEVVLGRPRTGIWEHLAVSVPVGLVHGRTAGGGVRPEAQDAHEVAAARLVRFQALSMYLSMTPIAHIRDAALLLSTDELPNAGVARDAAAFLHKLALDAGSSSSRRCRNLLFRAVALAPPGWVTPSSGLVGYLIDLLASGAHRGRVVAAWAAKSDSINRLRPKAAPTDGTIARAEHLVEKLGITRSLARRHLTLDEARANAIWSPSAPAPSTARGVFGHLRQHREPPPMVVERATTLGWLKFRRDVLPKTTRLQVRAQHPESLVSLATAVHEDAPPILSWDRADRRNPVNWWHPHPASPLRAWGLTEGYYDVACVVLQPSMWGNEDFDGPLGKSAFLLIEGCGLDISASALFPACLRADLHEVRKVVEAHSNATPLAEVAGSRRAAGVRVAHTASDNRRSTVVRATTSLGVITYEIDRWE